ncbi:ATP synthase subunit I [candidate division KSB1 bacterium]|nr:ATP synthase subunit I [candidate division KSB1 bacterium]
MSTPKINTLRLLSYTVLLFLLLSWPVYHWGGWDLFRSFSLGYLISVINILFSLVSIQWGFQQKTRTFYTVLFGGMALRFVFIAIIIFLIIRVLHWHVLGFLISFILFYIFLQYHEIRMITAELKKNKLNDDPGNS